MRRHDSTTLWMAAGFGAISGIRSMAGIALLSWGRHHRPGGTLRRLGEMAALRLSGNHRITTLLARRYVDTVTATLAAGEMTADKVADLPPRTELPALLGRAAFGALSGLAVAELRDGPRALAATTGALSAIASAHLFYQVRKAATDQSSIPDWAIGLAEDVLILIGGKRLIDQLR